MNKVPGMYRSESTFAVITPTQSIVPVAVTPELYENLGRDFDGFRGHCLFSQYVFDSNWSSWERHPAGDEIVYLLFGDVEMILETENGETGVRLLEPGDYVIIPRNTWHTARPKTRTGMLFITPGEGTEHRAIRNAR